MGVLDEDKNVGYLMWQRSHKDGQLQDLDWGETCNGRFDHVDTKLAIGGWQNEMKKYAKMQHAIAKKRKPILAIWGVDKASNKNESELIKITVEFIKKYKPKKLMISGKRAPKVAEGAERILS